MKSIASLIIWYLNCSLLHVFFVSPNQIRFSWHPWHPGILPPLGDRLAQKLHEPEAAWLPGRLIDLGRLKVTWWFVRGQLGFMLSNQKALFSLRPTKISLQFLVEPFTILAAAHFFFLCLNDKPRGGMLLVPARTRQQSPTTWAR